MTCETKEELRQNWPAGREYQILIKFGVSKEKYIEMHCEQGGLVQSAIIQHFTNAIIFKDFCI